MKKIKEKNIYNWVINSLEETTYHTFISTDLLFKYFCEIYNIKYDKANLLSFSVLLSKIFKNLNWKIEKSRVHAIRGYKFLQFKHTKNKLYLQRLSKLEEILLHEADIIRQLISGQQK